MEENTQLPKEMVEEIKAEAKRRGKNHMFIPMDGDYSSYEFHGFIVERTYETCATAYAAKAVINPIWDYADKHIKVPLGASKTEAVVKHAEQARKLLYEVFRKHESGLLPDRFIYEKIKTFLYGE